MYDSGETIRISGVNTDSRSTFLLVTGGNFPSEGVKLNDINQNAVNEDRTTLTRVSVEDDSTWYYDWNTSEISGGPLLPGEYTIYAVSDPKNILSLEGAVYDYNPIVIRDSEKSAIITSFSVEALDGPIVSPGDMVVASAEICNDGDEIHTFGINYTIWDASNTPHTVYDELVEIPLGTNMRFDDELTWTVQEGIPVDVVECGFIHCPAPPFLSVFLPAFPA